MKKNNTFNVQLINDDTCKIEAKCILPINSNQMISSNIYDTDNTQIKTSTFMLTSGSLNLSKTISNLSIQTMRISKNSISNSNVCNFYQSINDNANDIEKDNEKVSFDASIENTNLSTNSIVFVKKPDKSIIYTPSTICNYYLHSNEVTPNKSDVMKNSLKQNLKLDLNQISVYDENVTENNENISSLRNNINNIEELTSLVNKKTPIKYNKSQLKNTENRKSSPSAVQSPLENILNMNCKNAESNFQDLAKDVKKELVLNISELEIDDKLLENDIKTPTPNNFMNRINLNFTFNKLKEETPDKEYKILNDEEKKQIPKIEKNQKSSIHTNLKSLLNKNKTKTESMFVYTSEPKRERINYQRTSETNHDYYQTSINTLDSKYETSPKISSTKKSTQPTSTKSKSSYSKKIMINSQSKSNSKSKANCCLSNNSTIKQFLLHIMDKKKENLNITNNINIDKIVIHSSGNERLDNEERKFKKSNSIASDLNKKKKYVDIVKNYSNKNSASSITPNFNKKPIKARSNSKGKDGKVIEFSINYDQNSHYTKSSNHTIFKKAISPTSSKNNKNIVSPNIKVTKQQKPKMISNFSNYSKKQRLDENVNKENICNSNKLNIKKQIVSSKIATVAGDDDLFELDDI